MYEKHFGLKTRPFRPGLDVSGIFVGPAQVKVMASLKKALLPVDAVVSVTGAVGVGKTTVVNRALEGLTSKRAVARVGRMQLAADEVLELLLTEFDVSRQPNGTIQRFAAFKRLLHDWAIGGTRAFIIVEDAERIGNDALIELEALTACDSADSAGASIVLMGQSSLADQLSLPALARLRQRIRLRQSISPFTAAEVQGYLKHCMRAAGGDADSIFDPGAIDMLYRCSEGVPRVVNNLCESVLAAAAEAGATLVMPQLVQHVANEEFGLQPVLPPASRIRVSRKADRETESPPPAAPQRAKADVKPAESPAPAATVVKVQPAAVEPVVTVFEPITVVPFTPEPEVRQAPLKDHATPSATAVESPKTPLPAEVPKALPIAEPSKTPVALELPKAPAAATVSKAAVVEALPNAAPVTQVSKGPAVTNMAEAPAAVTAGTKSDCLSLEAIPELIQDTQPQLAALPVDDDLPDLTDLVIPTKSNGAAKVAPKAKPAPHYALPTLDEIPTLSGDLRIDTRAHSSPPKPAPSKVPPSGAGLPKVEQTRSGKPEPAQAQPAQARPAPAKKADYAPPPQEMEPSKADTTITEIPAWDRDPTLAELRPDIAALEAALAAVPEVAAKADVSNNVNPASAAQGTRTKAKEPPRNFDLPEITLEKKLQVKEIEAQELMRKAAPPDTLEVDADIAVKRKHGFDLDRLTAELGKARSLEDVDDKMAETLFGEEMAAAVAEVAAMVAADEAAKKPEPTPDVNTHKRADSNLAVQTPGTNLRPAAAAALPGNPALAGKRPVAPKNDRIPPSPSSVHPGKSDAIAKPVLPVIGPPTEITLAVEPELPPAPLVATPDPIEDQFGTSMTATLKALSQAQVRQMEEPEEEQKEKGTRRLFGLFRGSS